MIARVVRDFTWCADGVTEVTFARGTVVTAHDPRVTPAFLAWAEQQGLVEVVGRSVRQAPFTKGGAPCGG